MSDGELKKRILESHTYERYTTENGNKRLGILENELDEILDEAKKEFPMEWTEIGRLRSKVKSDDDFNDIFLMTDWFKKWFGDQQ
jgi:hypothetical protein